MQALLRVFLDSWDAALRSQLPGVTRSYVHELIDVRNRWAHERSFTAAEAARAVDTARQLATMIGAPLPAVDGERARSTKAAPPAGFARAGGRAPSQRDVMRAIYAQCAGDAERTIRAYAGAEQRGDVQRRSNNTGISAEAYARALFADGQKKGWLDE